MIQMCLSEESENDTNELVYKTETDIEKELMVTRVKEVREG